MASKLRWASLFALLLLMWTITTCWPHIRNEFFVLLGNRNETGGWYGWWSGNAGGLQIFEWLALGTMLYWHRTCHIPSCMRLGKYQAADGMFMLCFRHHPDLGERPGHAIIDRLHRERACDTR